MELTKAQIQQIESYLDFKDLKHIDIRFEVLDHIISDIETSMQVQNTGFAEAFKNTKVKWKNQLKNDSSWITGLAFSAPSVVIKKAKESYKKWLFLMIILAFLPMLFIDELKTLDNYSEYSRWIGTFLSVIMITPIIIWYYSMRKNGFKTTYLFLFEKQVFYSSVLSLIYSFYYNFSSNSLSYYLLAAQIALFYLGRNLYTKHQNSIKKYKLR